MLLFSKCLYKDNEILGACVIKTLSLKLLHPTTLQQLSGNWKLSDWSQFTWCVVCVSHGDKLRPVLTGRCVEKKCIPFRLSSFTGPHSTQIIYAHGLPSEHHVHFRQLRINTWHVVISGVLVLDRDARKRTPSEMCIPTATCHFSQWGHKAGSSSQNGASIRRTWQRR